MGFFRVLSQIVRGIWSSLQPPLRFLGWLSILLAVIALINDLTLYQIGMRETVATPLSAYIKSVAPESLAAFQRFIETQSSPILWAPVVQAILDLTPWISFTILGLALMWIGHRRERLNVFVN